MRNQKLSKPPTWTVLDALQWTAAYFESHHIDSPRLTAEILLAAVLAVERIDLYIRHDQPLSETELAAYRKMIRRRVRREPVAYILAEREFWGLRFAVSPDVLIPRPETEHLVEAALDRLPEASEPLGRVMDLGVGSGAIVVTLAVKRAAHRYFGIDRSYAALGMARENARRHHVADRIEFLAGDWFSALNPNGQGFDMILANPPYIASDQIPHLDPEIADHEPKGALDGGADGLDAIRAIIGAAPLYLKPAGCLLMEIGFDQKDAVARLTGQAKGYEGIEFVKDYGGHDRVAILKRV